MAINKVEANGETLIDLTSDTVTADTLVSGRTAHLASGVPVTGTFEPVTGVKGNAESTYRKGNVNLTPANIGAATSAQGTKADSAVQTIQIGGTAQAKTNGTVNLPAYPTKSSLGLGNVDDTSDVNKPVSTAQQTALNGKVSKAGDTMTGELKTSFNCVANGSIAIDSKVRFPVTLPNFIDVIRYSSGCSGSVQFSAYTLDDITIPSGWYNFEWLSHRTGGVNGAASADNCNYGALILTGMTVANAGYIVRYYNQVITEVHELYKGEELEAQVKYNTNQGVKNLCKVTAESQTINGVTFTVDKVAGTVTANGTANQLIFFAFKLQINDGKYILSGCPPTGSDSTYRLDIRNGVGGTTFTNAVDYGTGSGKMTLSGDKYLNIRIVSGYNCDNLVFKPMIRDASIKDNTFEPYAMSNAELTQKALIKEDDNAGGYVVDLDKDCKLQRNSNYIRLGNNSINLHTDSSNISLQCGTTGSPLRGVSITSTAVRMYFGLNTLTVDEDGLWFNGTKIAE